MTERDASFVAECLVWQFRRFGESGQNVRVFSDFAPDVQMELHTGAALRHSEIPVIACFIDSKAWTTLTTERLVWCATGRILLLDITEIADATVEPRALRGARDKERLADLTIRAADGESYRLKIEPGPPFFGFWNVLKTVAAANRKSRS